MTITTIPDNFTGAVALVGNQTVAPNDTVTTSTQQQIHVEGCVVLKGQLNLTITSNAVVGKQPLITTANPCLTGQFSEFNYHVEDNPPICSAELEYSSSSVVTNLIACPSEAVQLPIGAIVGGVVGGVVLLVIVALLVIFLVKPIRDRVMPNRKRMVDMDELHDEHGRSKTLGPNANLNDIYDNQGRSGENAIYE